jgi:NAD(P)-dependent dehydrogenase (short-subunit alcohol dehydrogenase family)
MDLQLGGRTALITGGSRGIGLAVARALIEEGCTVHLAARAKPALEAARESLMAPGGPVVYLHVVDLAAEGTATQLAEECGDVDILVNNAGAIPRGGLIELGEAEWRSAWDLKPFAYIDLTRALYRKMQLRRRGVIINIICVGGQRPTAKYLAGGTANAALMAFTEALGGESVDHGIRVVGINPGLVATERMVSLMQADANQQLGDCTRWRDLLLRRPFGRPAEPAEIANVVAFVASDKASYISGTVITIDGGSTTRQAPL